jgi:hypothetical protein
MVRTGVMVGGEIATQMVSSAFGLPVASQLCPNHWVPARPARSHLVPGDWFVRSLTWTERDGTGLSGTSQDSVEPPRNAQVVGSSPTSGSEGLVKLAFRVSFSEHCFGVNSQ